MERETLEVDVLFVGAGVASLACAIRLSKLLAQRDSAQELSLLVIEKGEQVGYHQLSGAVMDPRAIEELWPAYREEGFPIDAEVRGEALHYLGKRRSWPFPGFLLPASMHNRGHLIVSLQKVTSWLGERAESVGVEVYPGFPGAEILYEGDRVVGVRTADVGLGRDAQPKSTHQPGMDIRARVVVFGEGVRGSLTKKLIARQGLAGNNPQVYETGVKELWEIEQDLEGQVFHTMGWPLPANTYGGGWIYGLSGRRASLGLVVGLDGGNPTLNPHTLFQRWKTHPFVRAILAGGEVVRYGAKAIPGGGYHAMPRLHGDGFVIVGDGAGFLNMSRLKGIHLAMKSGMMAAEAVAQALQDEGNSAQALAGYGERFAHSWAYEELHGARNFRAAFSRGRKSGMVRAGLQMVFGGRLLTDPLPMRADHECYRKLAAVRPFPPVKADDQLTFDRLKDVYLSGTSHEEDQPCHLVVTDPQICSSRCTVEYGNPCQHFCPAQVYEWHEGLEINASNCVHCKTCDIADPYQVIEWTVPEGGGGPKYLDM